MSEPSNRKMILGPDCRINGELRVRGDLQVDCQCDGLIIVDGTLEVRETGRMKGRIRAGAARIGGVVEGEIVGEQGVAVIAGATVTGRIYSTRLLTVKGATLRAEVCIGPEALAEAPAWAQIDEELAQPTRAAQADTEADTQEDCETEAEPMTLNVTPPAEEEEVETAEQAAPAEEKTESPVPEPALAQESDVTPINTVPTSIRALLQRRPRRIGKGAAGMHVRQSA